MTNDDTVKLLKECNAGVKTAVASFDEVIDHIKYEKLKMLITKSKAEHEKIGDATHCKIIALQDKDKEPNPMAKAISWMKISGKLVMHDEDATVADLMIDGCNMGIKSLSRYLNQYKAADDEAKKAATDLIELEKQLMDELRVYL